MADMGMGSGCSLKRPGLNAAAIIDPAPCGPAVIGLEETLSGWLPVLGAGVLLIQGFIDDGSLLWSDVFGGTWA
jgi:hypothetical protein